MVAAARRIFRKAVELRPEIAALELRFTIAVVIDLSTVIRWLAAAPVMKVVLLLMMMIMAVVTAAVVTAAARQQSAISPRPAGNWPELYLIASSDDLHFASRADKLHTMGRCLMMLIATVSSCVFRWAA
jgi:hypothetical protein